MAKFRSQKNSFIAGEISPTAFGRIDLPQYQHACKTMRNMIPFLSGGAYRRPGTKWEDTIAASTSYAPAIIPFIIARDEAYVVLLGKTVGGAGYVKWYSSGGNDHDTLSSGSSSGPDHGLLAVTAATVLASTTLNAPWSDEWHDVQYTQSADVLYIVHPNRKPFRVSRTATHVFSHDVFDAGLTGASLRDAWPYMNQNATATTLTPSGASGAGITLTASAAFFNAKHVGALIKINHGGVIGCAQITDYTDSTHVTADVVVNFGATTAQLTWWESAWSNYRGWPRSVCFYQDRLIYGGNAHMADSMWHTQTSNYNVMSVAALITVDTAGDGATIGPLGAQPFTSTLLSNALNKIQWMDSGKTLFVGTLADEWTITPSSTGTYGADNRSALAQSHYGSGYYQPAKVGSELAFCLASEQEIRGLAFDWQQQLYSDVPYQLFFDEYPKLDTNYLQSSRRMRRFAWDSDRKILWCCDTAGNLFGMTRDRTLNITAWHTHQMGGYDATLKGGNPGSGPTIAYDSIYSAPAGSVVSLSVIPNPVSGGNDLWLVVKRKINGAYEYHIERLIGKVFPAETAYSDTFVLGTGAYHADASSLHLNAYPNSETYVFNTGHLKGQAVEGAANNTKGIFKVTGTCAADGSGTTMAPTYPPGILTEGTEVSFGLPFSAYIDPVRIEAGSQVGVAQGAVKRIHEVWVRLYRTLACKVGADASDLETLVFRTGSTLMGYSPELFTGDKRVKLDADYDRDGYMRILFDQPLPAAIISLAAEGMTYD